MRQVMGTLLRRDPEARYPSAASLLVALRECQREVGGPPYGRREALREVTQARRED